MLRIPILTYHSIDSTGSVLSISPALFRRQIEFLALQGYQSLSLSEALSLLLGKRTLSKPGIVLCFDDGFRSVYDVAFPVLRAHGFTATFFVISDYCGQTNDWPGQPAWIPRLPLMNWKQVEALVDSSWELAAHSATHADLTRLKNGELNGELLRCRTRLEEVSRHPIRWFAYPYGGHDARVRSVVRKYFEGACGTDLGFATVRSDPFELERIDAYYLRSFSLYRGLQSKWLVTYLQLRHWIRKARGK